MLRSTLIVAAAALLCSVSTAQNQVDPSDIHVVPVPIKHAGVFDWDSKSWLSRDRANQVRATSLIVYNNTCTWTGGAFYTGTGDCEDYISDGRIPGGLNSVNAPLGATADNRINFFEFGYCTTYVTGSVDIKVGCYDSLGGTCLGGIAPQPPSLASQAVGYFDFGAAAGFPLPGGTGTGLGCWVVGFNLNAGFCMQSDGDGFFDNVAALDNFNWSFQMDNPSISPASGVILSGDPGSSPVGGCTYNIPCGTDFFAATPCGHGLGQDDAFWTNIDNDQAGNTVNTGVACTSAPAGGTGCYWFGGYPANPYAGFSLRLGSAGECAGCTGNPTNYCTGGTSSSGCVATMSLSSGVPSTRSGSAPAIVMATNVEGNKNGLIFFGLAQAATPWAAGSSSFLCVKSPTQRTASQLSSPVGTAGTCVGVISTDLNALIQQGNGTLLGQQLFAGSTIDAQCWYRDPSAVKTTNLSNGLEVTVCP